MLDLLDYRRRVAEMYQLLRGGGTDAPEAHAYFRRTRDSLFRDHPQSPLSAEQKADFFGLRYHVYDPAYKVIVTVNTEIEPLAYSVDLGDDGQFTMTRFGQVTFTVPTGTCTLALYWINGYGGGVFLPFRDATNGQTTYGGGRYLLDTIKGVDLGGDTNQLILDFNYAYHPSCYYNARWVCPLAPPENLLDFPIPAGEMLMDTTE